MKLFYLEIKYTSTKHNGGTPVTIETWQYFTYSPIITELLSLVKEKPLLSRRNYRITNNQQLPTVAF